MPVSYLKAITLKIETFKNIQVVVYSIKLWGWKYITEYRNMDEKEQYQHQVNSFLSRERIAEEGDKIFYKNVFI